MDFRYYFIKYQSFFFNMSIGVIIKRFVLHLIIIFLNFFYGRFFYGFLF